MPDADSICARDRGALPRAVLFACTMNAVRSVMAAAILRHLAGPIIRVDSVGVRAGAVDPLIKEVMDEIGISVGRHVSKNFEDVANSEFDLIVTLSPEAHHKALRLALETPMSVEYWPTMDATVAGGLGEDEQLLAGYRQVRDQLFARIKKRFRPEGAPTV